MAQKSELDLRSGAVQNKNTKIATLPFVGGCIVLLGALLSYIIASHGNHINLYIPSVSEIGAAPPESGMLSLTFFLAAIVGSVVIIYRYFILSSCSRAGKVNVVSLTAGLASMLGLAVMAAFPMNTLLLVHQFGGVVFLLCSIGYFALSTILTFKVEHSSKMFAYRFLLTCLMALSGSTILVIYPIANASWKEFNHTTPALKKPTDKGFDLLIISSVLQWFVVFLTIFYHISYSSQFEHCTWESRISSAVKDTPKVPQTLWASRISSPRSSLTMPRRREAPPPLTEFPLLEFPGSPDVYLDGTTDGADTDIPKVHQPQSFLSPKISIPRPSVHQSGEERTEFPMEEFPLPEGALPDPVAELLDYEEHALVDTVLVDSAL